MLVLAHSKYKAVQNQSRTGEDTRQHQIVVEARSDRVKKKQSARQQQLEDNNLVRFDYSFTDLLD